MVYGCVGFVEVFALTLRPWRSFRAGFVRKVSSFFQVVSFPSGGAVWLAVRLLRLPSRPRDRTQ
jgi:hypothetical protein